MIDRLLKLKENGGQFKTEAELSLAIKNDAAFKSEIEALSREFLGRSPSGCSNCHADAYHELLAFKIERLTCKFELRRGKLLYDVKGDASKLLSQNNITDSLALYHLRTNPGCERFFVRLPENWREMVVSSIAKDARTGTITAETDKNPTAGTVVAEASAIPFATASIQGLPQARDLFVSPDAESVSQTPETDRLIAELKAAFAKGMSVNSQVKKYKSVEMLDGTPLTYRRMAALIQEARK